jgi:nicotinamidase-related amidase
MITLPGGESDSPAWIRLRMRAGQSEPAASAGWTFAVAGTWGAEFVADLLPERRDPVVTKYRSSAFHGTDLEVILRSNGVRTVVVTGCTTEGCVESTVRDAGMHDYFTVLASDCVGSDDPVLHEASMLVMTAYRTDVATSDQILREWTPLQVGSEPQACGAAPLPRGDHN